MRSTESRVRRHEPCLLYDGDDRRASSDPLAGYSFGARYLVDIVSAASVDIVSTASRRWEEIRHVVSLDGGYSLAGFDLRRTGEHLRRADYLVARRERLDRAGFSREEPHRPHSLQTIGTTIIGRTGTSFDVFSRKASTSTG